MKVAKRTHGPDERAPVNLVAGPWSDSLKKVLGTARERVLICAPFISPRGAAMVEQECASAGSIGPRSTVLTDLSPRAVCDGVTDPSSIYRIHAVLKGSRVVHLPRLHAKVYCADGTLGIVTSGNMTSGGIDRNYEYGVLLRGPTLVARVEADVLAYGELGATLESEALARYCDIASTLIWAARAEVSAASRRAQRAMTAALSEAGVLLIRAQLGGGSVHAVFARTILYLLRHHGSMPTEKLHPLIQEIHPDLCDDTQERVIDGERFGKKWKHAVRTAQQQLKKKGVIAIEDGDWRLTNSRAAE